MVFGIVAGSAHLLAQSIALEVTSFDEEKGKKATVTANSAGVRSYAGKIGLETDLERIAKKSEQLRPDDSLSGVVTHFESTPSCGGLLVLMNRGITHHVHGLVNVATGQPRVELEIMSRP